MTDAPDRALNLICADLISNIAHDINSLLTIAREQKSLSEEFTSKITYMERVNSDLVFYIRDLDISRSRLQINTMMQALISELDHTDGVKIKTSIETADQFINVDIEHFNRAFQNIVRNAQRAARLKGGKVLVRAAIDKTDLEVTITDNGPGIPEEFVERIKKPFFTTYKAQGHSGFGLAIAEKIITAHNGSVEIKNHAAGGVVSCIRLPLEQ